MTGWGGRFVPHTMAVRAYDDRLEGKFGTSR